MVTDCALVEGVLQCVSRHGLFSVVRCDCPATVQALGDSGGPLVRVLWLATHLARAYATTIYIRRDASDGDRTASTLALSVERHKRDSMLATV